MLEVLPFCLIQFFYSRKKLYFPCELVNLLKRDLKKPPKMSFPERLKTQLVDALADVQKNRREECQAETCAYCKKTATKEEDAAAVEAAATLIAVQILEKLLKPDGINVVRVAL